ncbi:MAG: peptidylprolyl isomerase [Rhizobacter sp.]
MNKTARVLSLCAALASTPLHAAEPALPPGAVAVVNGEAVPRSLLDELVRSRSVSGTTPEAKDRSRMLDDLVNAELMSQRAQSTGLAAKPQTRAELDLAYKLLLGQQLLRQLVTDMKIDDATLQARYRDLPPNVQIDVSHILVKEEAEARSLIEQLERGANFADLARRHSLDTGSQAKGGALGLVPASELEAPFAKAALALRPGQYTREPAQTEHGWHVIRLTSQRTNPKRPFEDLKAGLRAQIVTEQLQSQLAQWKKEAKVTVLKAP